MAAAGVLGSPRAGAVGPDGRRGRARQHRQESGAPRRQFVIILSGQLEIGCGDGSKQVFGPGDARLVEDTTGKGHTTRVVGNEPVLTATVPLAQA